MRRNQSRVSSITLEFIEKKAQEDSARCETLSTRNENAICTPIMIFILFCIYFL